MENPTEPLLSSVSLATTTSPTATTTAASLLVHPSSSTQIEALTTPSTTTKLPLLHKLAVGGIAGIIGATSTFPIDLIKTRLQSQAETSIPKLCRIILVRDGIRGFYHGLPPTLLGILPEKAIKLAFNDYFREMFELPDGRVTMPMQLLASSLAGSMQVIATNPYEIVKIRLQTQNQLPAHARKSMMGIIQELGLRGLYKGTTSTLCRDVPYAMIFFPSYASIKMFITEEITHGEETVPGIVCAGATAGALAAALVTPMDVIKTRWQVKGSIHTSGISCLRHILANEGGSALFKGVVPRMFVQAPLFAITLLAFELQKKYMANRTQE